MAALVRLCSSRLKELQGQGAFLIDVRQYRDRLDVSSYVAAQNATGWVCAGDRYLAVGSTPSALLLANVGFSIPVDSFVPAQAASQDPPDLQQPL